MIVLRDLASGKDRSVLYREPTRDGQEPTERLILSPDGKFAAINGYQRSIHFVNLEAGKLVPGERIVEFNLNGPFAIFSPDGKTAYLRGYEPYEVATNKKLPMLSASAEEPACFAISPDGTTMAITEPQVAGTKLLKHIVLWDVAGDKEKARFRISPPLETGRTFRSIALSPDGKTIAYGYEYRANSGDISKPMIGFVDAATGQTVAAMFIPKGSSALSYMPDGKSIISGAGFGTVHVYRVPAAKAVSKDTTSVNDLLVKGSVWTSESPSRVFTILERDGETFKARFIHSAFDREVTGKIKDGKISWLAKDVVASRGDKGGDNVGTIFKDGSIDFVADGGSVRYTLKLKKDR